MIAFDIAHIEQSLSQQGHFCLIGWLLSYNHLYYTDYEDWRYGRLDYLDKQLQIDKDSFATLLAKTTSLCTSLGLCNKPQDIYCWDGELRTGLSASNNTEYHQQLTQHWLRPQDLPQLDLFMDNTAQITENELRTSLSGRCFDRSGPLLQQLLELNPTHQYLGAYQDLLNYGQHMQSNPKIDADSLAQELEGLTTEVLPLAKEVLLAEARDYLAFAWRRLANNLNGIPFDKQNPKLHQSFALAQIPDWLAVQQCLEQDSNLYQQALLLERLAFAYQALQQNGPALLLWCLLIELDILYAEEAIEQQKGQMIYQLWQHFWQLVDDCPSEYFPAFVLASSPGLLQHLETFAPLTLEANQAMIRLLRCHLAGEDEIKAREDLQAINPILLRMYMDVRKA